ncbi:helix-turn-helix domain-containing protein [Chloroflexota bacterium]
MAVVLLEKEARIVSFLKELMHRRKRLPSQLAVDLGVSHATVRRWLLGEDVPNVNSCRCLAEYSGIPLQKVLVSIGHLPEVSEKESTEWPEFSEYVRQKYPEELSEDLVTMVEDLIERKRQKKYERMKR